MAIRPPPFSSPSPCTTFPNIPATPPPPSAPLQYAELDSKRTALELFLTAALSPHRPWWLPATWLLPKTIPLQVGDKGGRARRGGAGAGVGWRQRGRGGCVHLTHMGT